MIPRKQLYDRTPAGDALYIARCRRDSAEAHARGWTHIHLVTICEPEQVAGRPPADHPKSAHVAYGVPLPDYAIGEDGGYQHTTGDIE